MNDEQLAHLSAATALQAMMAKGWLDICTIDKAARLLKRVPDRAAYEILSPLHCVNFRDMPADLREAIPSLIGRCLEFAWTPAPAPAPIDASPSTPARRGILRLLPSREP